MAMMYVRVRHGCPGENKGGRHVLCLSDEGKECSNDQNDPENLCGLVDTNAPPGSSCRAEQQKTCLRKALTTEDVLLRLQSWAANG